MSVALFSISIFLVAAVCMAFGIINGIKKGLIRSAISFAVTLCSMITAGVVAVLISKALSDVLYDLVESTGLTDGLSDMDALVYAYSRAIVTPFMFVILFALIILIFGAIMKIILNTKLKKLSDDSKTVPENAPWHIKHSTLLGAIVGGISGFIVAAAITSPISGTLKVADVFIDCVEHQELLKKEFNLKEKDLEEIKKYTKDIPSSVLYACGGKLVYDSVAKTELNGKNITLTGEAENITVLLNDFIEVLPVISEYDHVSDKEIAAIEKLKADINKSETFKYVAAAFLSQAAENWLEGKTYAGISKPALGEDVQPVMDELLEVAATTTPETVSVDIVTVLNVYLIFAENKDVFDAGDFETIYEDGILENICNELISNQRTGHLVDVIADIAFETAAEYIKTSLMEKNTYSEFKSDIADIMNTAKDYAYEDRVELISSAISDKVSDEGYTLPLDVAETIAKTMLSEISYSEGSITADRIDEFLNYYIGE